MTRKARPPKPEAIAAEASAVAAAWKALSAGERGEIVRYYDKPFSAALKSLRSVLSSGNRGEIAKVARRIVRAWEALWEDCRDEIAGNYWDLCVAITGLQLTIHPKSSAALRRELDRAARSIPLQGSY